MTEWTSLEGYDLDNQVSEEGFDTNFLGFNFEGSHYVVDINDRANAEEPKFYRVISHDSNRLDGTGELVEDKTDVITPETGQGMVCRMGKIGAQDLNVSA